MRVILGGMLTLGLVFVAGLSADEKAEKIDGKKLLGKWEPAEVAKGAKVVVEFMKEGKVRVDVEFGGKKDKVEGQYKLDGNKLTVTIAKGGKEDKDTSTITKLTDDELVMKDEKGKSETLKRYKDKK